MPAAVPEPISVNLQVSCAAAFDTGNPGGIPMQKMAAHI
jgi:hypothetical protein